MVEQRNVALVGRPNVGKSRLFNRLAGRRIAIVHDQPGVTRDVNTVEIEGDYTLMDTGGIGLVSDESGKQYLSDAVEEQVYFAMQAAQLVLMVVDSKEGCTPLDEEIVSRLRHFGKKVILVVNKIDQPEHEARESDFAHLGFDHNHLVSAEHGRGIDDLRQSIAEALGPKPEEEPQPEGHRVKICFAGRPNVGKSSLCNRLLNSERLVVSEVPGTTRDSVSLDLDYKHGKDEIWPFRLMDTAGLRKRGKMNSSVEYFSSVRSENAIENADVVFLVLDALTGVTTQDKSLAGHIVKSGKSLAILVNKWDLALETFQRDPLSGYKDEKDFRKKYANAVVKELFFIPNSPVLFVSALKGYALEDLLATARKIDERQLRKLPTAKLNQLIAQLLERQRPKLVKGKRFKVYYSVQTGNRPYRIRLFCNQAANLDDRYRRYLEKGFISEFKLDGCPVRFELIGKPKRKKDFYLSQSK